MPQNVRITPAWRTKFASSYINVHTCHMYKPLQNTWFFVACYRSLSGFINKTNNFRWPLGFSVFGIDTWVLVQLSVSVSIPKCWGIKVSYLVSVSKESLGIENRFFEFRYYRNPYWPHIQLCESQIVTVLRWVSKCLGNARASIANQSFSPAALAFNAHKLQAAISASVRRAVGERGRN